MSYFKKTIGGLVLAGALFASGFFGYNMAKKEFKTKYPEILSLKDARPVIEKRIEEDFNNKKVEIEKNSNLFYLMDEYWGNGDGEISLKEFEKGLIGIGTNLNNVLYNEGKNIPPFNKK